MAQQLSFIGLAPPSPCSSEPTDPETRAALHLLRLGAVARTWDWVAKQIWAEPLPIHFYAQRVGLFIALLIRFRPEGKDADCLRENHASVPFRGNALEEAWNGLWEWMQDPSWVKSTTSFCGIRKATLHRFLEEARSDEARALYELELLTPS